MNYKKEQIKTLGMTHLQAYISYLQFWKKFPAKRFLIFAQGRTGSELLVQLLNCHPDILCHTEIFNMRLFGKVKYPMCYARGLSKIAVLHNSCAYGFKVKIYQLSRDQKYHNYRKIIRQFYKHDWRFIFLYRVNILRQCLSNLLAEANKKYSFERGQEIPNQKIAVNCKGLLQRIKEREKYIQMELEILKDIDYLPLVYEKDLLYSSTHQETANKVCKYIGLEPHPVATNLQRIAKDDLRNNILNFDEVSAFFAHTEYCRFLE